MKKGFTLIELLTVIAVLAIILLIAVPYVINTINNVKNNAFVKDEQMMISATKNYLAANLTLVPVNIGDTIEVKLSDLQTNNLITTIKDPKNNSNTCNGYVIVTKLDNTTYDYTPHLNCDNNIGDLAADGLVGHYKFDEFQESTTNLIPGGQTNAYPTVGNGYTTYNTNQYNSNTYFSIGTIESVTNNIVTLSTITHPIYTYDVLTPQTTGGGVTAGTNYFIKKQSANSFSLHTYNSSQNGSLGFAVYNPIYNDVRIPINSTNFPTMWHGPAHLPNSSLLKEIIPNCFSSNGITHECVRLNTKHKPEGDVDGMAYGVNPPVIQGKTYTFSFYYRAADQASIGATITLELYTGSGWVGDSVTKTMTSTNWERYEINVVAPNTGGTNLYFFPSRGTSIDISEIQCEQKNYTTPFTVGTRTPIVKDYSGNGNSSTLGLNTTPKWVTNVRNNTGAYQFDSTSTYIDLGNKPNFNLTNTGTITLWAKPSITYPSSTASTEFRGLISKSAGGGSGQPSYYIDWYGTNSTRTLRGGIGDGAGENTVEVTNYDFNNSWHHLALTWNGSNIILYSDGLEINRTAQIKNAQIIANPLEIGRAFNSSAYTWNGFLDEVRLYNRALSNDEIKQIYISENLR